jgi:hypothetical protein
VRLRRRNVRVRNLDSQTHELVIECRQHLSCLDRITFFDQDTRHASAHLCRYVQRLAFQKTRPHAAIRCSGAIRGLASSENQREREKEDQTIANCRLQIADYATRVNLKSEI